MRICQPNLPLSQSSLLALLLPSTTFGQKSFACGGLQTLVRKLPEEVDIVGYLQRMP